MPEQYHRGKKLKELITLVNPNRQNLIRELGIDSKTLYNWYTYEDLPWPTIAKVLNWLKQNHLNVDPLRYYPDLPDNIPMVKEDSIPYGNDVIKRLQAELENERNKYMNSLEREASLLRRGLMDGLPFLIEEMKLQNNLLKQLINTIAK